MTTNDVKEKIIPYIGETLPYICLPENIIFNGNRVETEIKGWDFENENFSNLIKQLSSIGSLSLYNLLNDTSQEKIYFLGEKLRIRKLSYKTSDIISITSDSFLESNRKGRSYIHVKDAHSGELLYSSEFDYYIIAKEAFKLFYQDFLTTTPIEFYDENLPESKMIETGISQYFTIYTEPFTPDQCKGHFDNYPIVPFVYISHCILKEIYNFLEDQGMYEIDSMEGYASKALPTGVSFMTEVFYQRFLKNIVHFKCEIKDASGKSYGIVVFNIRSKT